MKMGDILKSNWIYVLWFAFYFVIALAMFSFTWYGFLIVLIIYAISISLALSQAGENLLRAINGVRHIATQQEREYILPLFQEVYKQAKSVTPELSNDIEIFMTDEMHVNAYAFGRNTVVVTRGLIETMDEEQVMGILAHEFGHIVHGHTVMLLLNLIGNGVFSIMILFSRVFMFFVEMMVSSMDDNRGMGNIMATIMHYCFEWTIIGVTYFATAIIAINSRKNEFQADSYAMEIGHADGLLSGLYILQQMSMGRIKSLLVRLTNSHPHIAYRIERLERNNFRQLAG